MRVLVTGCGGFVGSHLLPHLRAAGHEVTGHDRELDVTDAEATARALAGARAEAVVHLAAQSSAALSRRDRDLTFHVNVEGARGVLTAVERVCPEARVLLVSTGEVYGVGERAALPFREDAPPAPGSPYAESKVAAEAVGREFARRGLRVVHVRPFSHTGPGQTDTFVVPSFARQLAEAAVGRREPVLSVGNLDSVRDFLDVADVVRAYAALLADDVSLEAYNVASGVGRRIGDVLDTLREISGVEVKVRVDPERFRPTDQGVGDASRLRAATGWTPQVDFHETLEQVFKDWSQRVRAA